MKYIAQNILKTGSHPASKEYSEIPEIKEARPRGVGFETSLQEIDGTNICMWYKRSSVYWNPASDPFIVTAEVNPS